MLANPGVALAIVASRTNTQPSTWSQSSGTLGALSVKSAGAHRAVRCLQEEIESVLAAVEVELVASAQRWRCYSKHRSRDLLKEQTQRAGLSLNVTEWGQQLKKPTGSGTASAQGQATVETWMRSGGWRGCVAPNCMLIVECGRRRKGRRAAKGMVESLLQRRCDKDFLRQMADLFAFTLEKVSQRESGILSNVGQWLRHQALAFIVGDDFRFEPTQLEATGRVHAVGGCCAASGNGHTVALRH